MKKLIILLLSVFIFCSCDGQVTNNNENSIEQKKETLLIFAKLTKQILSEQLKKGISPSDHKTYNYTEKDLDITVPILKGILESNGYKPISDEKFNNQIKAIFGRTIDPNLKSKYLYINFNNKCNREIVFNPNDFSDVNGTYIIKGENIISDFFAIPQIVDYQKEYPDLQSIENDRIIISDEIEKEKIDIPHWKDVVDLKEQRKKNIQTLVARNMLFFNDSKAHANWLIAYDTQFVKTIVTIFGYDEEPKFNELVIKDYTTGNPENDIKIGNIIFTKNCQKVFEIRDKILKSYISVFNETEDAKVILPLKYYSSYIMELKGNNEFTDGEKVKVIAFLANTFDPQFKKYHSQQPNWGEMTILADYRDFLEADEWQKVIEDYKKNNYYGLSDLKNMIEYANKFDSIGAPD